MNKQTDKKLFAFKVVEKKAQAEKKTEVQWKAREGVASAGCTFPSERYGTRLSKDGGVYC